MSKLLRVGVVGVGYLGKFHARIYNRMADVELVGVADTDKTTAETIAEECGCEAFTDPTALVGKVDAVSIVVPTIYHLEVARPYLEQGTHMLMEKPIAPDLAAGTELVALADKAGVTFQVGHLERYNAGVQAIIERAKDPRFIEVHRLGTFVQRATDVDVVTDLMIHDIDIVMAMVASPIKNIAAAGTSVLTDHVDIANARLEFENGAVANVTASRVSNKKFRRIRVFSKSNYYGMNYEDQQLEIVTAKHGNKEGDMPDIISETLTVETQLPLDAELADFVTSIKEKRKPKVDGATGLEAMRVALAVKERIAACLT